MGRSHAKVHKQRRNLNTHVFPSARESFTLRPRAGIDRIQRRIPTSGTNSVYTDPSKMRLSLSKKLDYQTMYYMNQANMQPPPAHAGAFDPMRMPKKEKFRTPKEEEEDFFDAQELLNVEQMQTINRDVYRDLIAARESPPAQPSTDRDVFYDDDTVSTSFLNEGGFFDKVVEARASAVQAQAERAERLIEQGNSFTSLWAPPDERAARINQAITENRAARTITQNLRLPVIGSPIQQMRRTHPPPLQATAPAPPPALRRSARNQQAAAPAPAPAPAPPRRNPRRGTRNQGLVNQMNLTG